MIVARLHPDGEAPRIVKDLLGARVLFLAAIAQGDDGEAPPEHACIALSPDDVGEILRASLRL